MASGISSKVELEISRRECVRKLALHETSPRVARRLLGSFLVRRKENQLITAKIVETEAYREDDPASHSCRGPTSRSKVMFGPPGNWYIYKCYGIHWMINVVCGPEDSGEAVLIRSAAPRQGIDIMEQNRGLSGKELTNGPGKLAAALDIDDAFNGRSVASGVGFYLSPEPPAEDINVTRRVGIQKGVERPWRFYLDNKYVTESSHNVDS